MKGDSSQSKMTANSISINTQRGGKKNTCSNSTATWLPSANEAAETKARTEVKTISRESKVVVVQIAHA